MIFYLGDIVKGQVSAQLRTSKNKTKSWEYGYNEAIDTVIISKDGTLGEIYCIEGVNIGLPQKPESHEIINHGKKPKDQKWEIEEMPAGLNELTQNEKRFEEFIARQFKNRHEGVWIYLNGKAVYITGTYWFFIQCYNEEKIPPKLRIIQSELMIFWEACKADYRSYGYIYVKNRRFGASALGNGEILESGTINEDKILGMISKKGDDARKIFNRLIKAFKRLPCYFKPVWDGTSTPKKELILSEPTKKRRAGELKKESDGLDTVIGWHTTELNAMDGEKIYRSLLDEAGKYPKDVPFDRYWSIVKTSHRLGAIVVGKSFVVSTVNAKKNGGAEFEKVFLDSDVLNRNLNDQTGSGLYSLFIPAKYGLEGFYDEYGFSIVDDPEVPFKMDNGQYMKYGSINFLKNELEALVNDPEKYNEHLRQFPNTLRDAFRDEATDCSFNLMKLMEQIDHNEFELDDSDYGNNEVERGNFSWVDGIQDGLVKWNPDPQAGRFWIVKNCHPPVEMRNLKEKKLINGILAWSPMNEDIGCFGVDPYNRSKTVDSRGSKGSIHLSTKYNAAAFPNDAFILEYIDRPATVELFFEDVLMAMVYFSMPMLCELSNERFLAMIKDRGYRHFSMNNPFKSYKDLSPTEKEFGGAPAQDAKIGEAQFYAIESYIQDHIGIARDDSKRPEGDMGYMPFSRTLVQWKEVDPNNRTKFDAYISSSLSRVGNRKKMRVVEESKPILIPFKRYNNDGSVSRAY
jgi:hypothetical protein